MSGHSVRTLKEQVDFMSILVPGEDEDDEDDEDVDEVVAAAAAEVAVVAVVAGIQVVAALSRRAGAAHMRTGPLMKAPLQYLRGPNRNIKAPMLKTASSTHATAKPVMRSCGGNVAAL